MVPFIHRTGNLVLQLWPGELKLSNKLALSAVNNEIAINVLSKTSGTELRTWFKHSLLTATENIAWMSILKIIPLQRINGHFDQEMGNTNSKLLKKSARSWPEHTQKFESSRRLHPQYFGSIEYIGLYRSE